jgi:hypothetical protein
MLANSSTIRLRLSIGLIRSHMGVHLILCVRSSSLRTVQWVVTQNTLPMHDIAPLCSIQCIAARQSDRIVSISRSPRGVECYAIGSLACHVPVWSVAASLHGGAIAFRPRVGWGTDSHVSQRVSTRSIIHSYVGVW